MAGEERKHLLGRVLCTRLLRLNRAAVSAVLFTTHRLELKHSRERILKTNREQAVFTLSIAQK